MDIDDHSNSNASEIWEWQGEEFCHPRGSQSVNQNEDDWLCMLDEQTPIKDCADMDYQCPTIGENTNKGSDESREFSQLNRRRMLQFSCTSGTNFARETSSALLNIKGPEYSISNDGISECLQWNAEWSLGFSDDSCGFAFEELDQSSDAWLLNCLNDNEIHCSSDEMKNGVAFNQQADISECYDNSAEMENELVQEIPDLAPVKMLKGKKSHKAYIKPPRKLTTVAYPFALIKPCGVHGDVTLNDINQRIHAPPRSRLKHKKDEDARAIYPMSTFSGKPVVVKTKVHTEGRQGSITIMRTQG